MDGIFDEWKGRRVSLGTFMGGMEPVMGRLLGHRYAYDKGPYWVCIDIDSTVERLRRPTWFCLGPLMGIAVMDED